MRNTIQLYTDGACTLQHEKQPGGWGAYLVFGDITKEIYGGELYTTNNRMEMLSVIKGLRQIHNKSFDVEVFVDSAYVCNAFNQNWIINWIKNGWINSKKQPVENKDLWLEIIDEVNKFNSVTFNKVKGHATCEGNKVADKLAVKGKKEILDKPIVKIVSPEIKKIVDDFNKTPIEDLMLAIELMEEHDKQRCLATLRKVCGL